MITLRKRLGLMDNDESGLSLIEIVVAMMIFALISMGVVYALLSSLKGTSDSATREVATNLAAQQIDDARDTSDIFGLLDDEQPNLVFAGRTFDVVRKTQWVSDPNLDTPCGAGGGALQYKRVNITISWDNMRTPDSPVRADTLIAAKTRISDPSAGTILVSASDSTPNPLVGASITVSPAISPAPGVTDSQGCAYLLKVPPGTYTITLKKTGYVDPTQNAAPSQTVNITAGSAVAPTFTMEAVQPLNLIYASNATGTVLFPNTGTGLNTSLLHASDPVLNSNGTPATLQLYPFADGYTAVAGQYLAPNGATVGCQSVNPVNWISGPVSGTTYTSPISPAVIPAPGATLKIPMGLVKVTGTAVGQSVFAVSQAAGPSGTADPGCGALTMKYTFTSVLTLGQVQLALPFGTWKLYYGTSATGTQIPKSSLAVTAPSSTGSSNTVTLDPRLP
jgi:type II secretory pathway pseudopilin PulG